MTKPKQKPTFEARQRGLRMPIDLDDWLETKKWSPAESFTSVVCRLLYAVKTGDAKGKK